MDDVFARLQKEKAAADAERARKEEAAAAQERVWQAQEERRNGVRDDARLVFQKWAGVVDGPHVDDVDSSWQVRANDWRRNLISLWFYRPGERSRVDRVITIAWNTDVPSTIYVYTYEGHKFGSTENARAMDATAYREFKTLPLSATMVDVEAAIGDAIALLLPPAKPTVVRT